MDKILVGLKRAVDYNVRVQVKGDGSGVETDGVKMSINPFDEIALEEALRIKERGEAAEVVVVSVGSSESQQQLRTGLAMGADRAVLVETGEELDSLSVARIFKALVERENADLVILGKQAIDNDNSQTGQMLAAIWGRPQATFASELVLNGDKATVTREVDIGGQRRLAVNLFDRPRLPRSRRTDAHGRAGSPLRCARRFGPAGLRRRGRRQEKTARSDSPRRPEYRARASHSSNGL